MNQVYQLDHWLEGYLDYLHEVRRQSPGTIKDVRCTLRRVCRYLDGHHNGVELWQLSLRDYVKWLENERVGGSSPQTLGKFLSHLRGVLDYAWRSGRSERNVLDGFRLQDASSRLVPAFLTEQEAKSLVEACPARQALERAHRVMVLLLYGCGLRTSELCALNVQDINRDRRELFVQYGKGGRQRYVPIPGGVFIEVLAYLCERGGKRGALFRTAAKGARVSARYVGGVVQEAAQRAELAKVVTPKTLRHSFATHLMDRGVDLAVISQLLGHRSPTETGVYLHVLPQRPRQATDQLKITPPPEAPPPEPPEVPQALEGGRS
jgi:site-specific recombinase XerD